MKAEKPFSILIPTFNRREKLLAILEQLMQQEGVQEGEILVGIDGSTDGTEDMLAEFSKSYGGTLRWFAIPNSGRSVIRNQLIDRSAGELLIFIQDDIVVRPGWLQAHLQAHQEHLGAQVGFMTWYPNMTITPYMKWLESGGHMLRFDGLQDGHETDYWHFYMGNLSLPRRLLGDLRFDESIPCYGWEDILFGFQFAQRGGKIFYAQQAAAYHWDEYREENFKSYIQSIGKSAALVHQRYPEMGCVPPTWKSLLLKSAIRAGRVVRPILPQQQRWYLDMKQWFLESCERQQQLSHTA